MIVYRPQDRTKVVVLIPSIIAVLLYFLFGVLPMMSKMRQDASPAAPQPDPSAATSAAKEPAAPVAPRAALANANLPAETTSDPFKPPVAMPLTAQQMAALHPATQPAVTKINSAPVQPALTAVPAGTKPGTVIVGPTISPATGNLAGPGVGQAGRVGPAPTAVASTNALTLQGVVLADRAVGVFRASDQTFYKSVGETVLDGLILKKVTDAGVLLAKGRQLYVLEVGHSELNPTTEKIGIPAIPIGSGSFASAGSPANAGPTSAAPALETVAQMPPVGSAVPGAIIPPAALGNKEVAQSGSKSPIAGPIVASIPRPAAAHAGVFSIPAETPNTLQPVSMIVHRKARHKHRVLRHRHKRRHHARHRHKTRARAQHSDSPKGML